MNISTLIQKYKDSPIQARASIWYTICNILQKGISFLIVPIYVRVLTTAEYGQYSVFQSWKEILIIFATLNLYCGVFTKAMVDYPDDRDQYTSCMQGLTTILTMAMFVIYCVSNPLWEKIMVMDTVTTILMFAYFVFYPAFLCFSLHLSRTAVSLSPPKWLSPAVASTSMTPSSISIIETSNVPPPKS